MYKGINLCNLKSSFLIKRRKNMKRIFTILLIVIFAISMLSGCGRKFRTTRIIHQETHTHTDVNNNENYNTVIIEE